MCFVLYAGTVKALSRVAWDKEAPDLCVEPLKDHDAAIKQYFSLPEVQYVGSTSGCGCDFPNVMLQNGEWPTVETQRLRGMNSIKRRTFLTDTIVNCL